MFVFGGRLGVLENSNRLYTLNLSDLKWTILKPTGEKPIGVDGHTMVEYPKGQLTSFGGFAAKPHCLSLNYLQIYDLAKDSF